MKPTRVVAVAPDGTRLVRYYVSVSGMASGFEDLRKNGCVTVGFCPTCTRQTGGDACEMCEAGRLRK